MTSQTSSGRCLSQLGRVLTLQKAVGRPRHRYAHSISVESKHAESQADALLGAVRELFPRQTTISTHEVYNRNKSFNRARSSHLEAELESYKNRAAWRDLKIAYERSMSAAKEQPFCHNLYLLSLSRLKDESITAARNEFLQNPGKPIYNQHTSTIFLRSLNQLDHASEAFRVFGELVSAGWSFQLASYNELLRAAALGGAQLSRLQLVLEHMKDSQISPSQASFCHIVTAYCKLHQPDLVWQQLNTAIAVNRMSTELCNIALHYFVSSKDLVNAWKVLDFMHREKIARDSTSYQGLLEHALQNNHMHELTTLFARLKEDQIIMSIRNANTILTNFVSNNLHSQSEALIDLLIESKVAATAETAEILFKNYTMIETSSRLSSKLHKWLSLEQQRSNESLYELIRLLRASARIPSPLTSVIHDVEHFLNADQPQAALTAYKSLQERGVRPPMQLFMIMLKGLLQFNLTTQAHSICRGMHLTQLQRSLHFQTTLLSMRGNSHDHIDRTISFMRKEGIALDLPFFTAAAWRLYKDHRFHDSINMLKNAISLGLVLDLIAWITLIEALAKTRDTLGLIWSLQRMRENRIKLDRNARKRIRRIIKVSDGTEEEKSTMRVEYECLIMR